ncbi:MAG TPA: DUF1611 domain-containing protein [Drouetiella sp.]|jgi:uncharacterized NAD-dependent epimerase/dehydratase family protein
MYLKPSARLAIYAQDEFGKGQSKTAEGVIRYARNPIAAVIDKSEAGNSVKSATGIECAAPIVSSVQEALQHKPDALLLGAAWTGGQLPDSWRDDIILALENGLDVVNGLHDFLSDDERIVEAANKNKKLLFDVRRPPDNIPVAAGLARNIDAFTVLTVGTDCNVGKMTTSLELWKEAKNRGVRAEFIATGQTGIMIAGGSGIAIDRVIGDFMAGAAEQMVLAAAKDHELILVEGQGSLAHPGFSGVTLALMHGSAPKAMILCHKATKKWICQLTDFPLPNLAPLIKMSEAIVEYVQPAKVIGVAINTVGLTDEEARRVIADAKAETGLPCTDPVRFGAAELVDAIELARKNYRK